MDGKANLYNNDIYNCQYGNKQASCRRVLVLLYHDTEFLMGLFGNIFDSIVAQCLALASNSGIS